MGTHLSNDRHESGRVLGESSSPSASLPPGDRTSTVPGALHVQAMVAEFHRALGYQISTDLASAGDATIDLWISLLQEELDEVVEAMRSGDVLAVAHELADLDYVTHGVANTFRLAVPDVRVGARSLVADCGAVVVAIALRLSGLASEIGTLVATIRCYAAIFGVDLDVAVAAVHEANMSKLAGVKGSALRPDGKVIRGPHFQVADMRPAVDVNIQHRALRDDFTVPIGASPEPPPWWLDGLKGVAG